MHHLTSSQLRQAADLKEKIEALNTELAAVFGDTAPAPVEAPDDFEVAIKAATEGIEKPEPVEAAKPGKRTMSPAHKAALQAAQALRWAKQNAAKGQPAAKSTKGTRGKSVEGVTGLVLKKISDEQINAFIGAERGLSDLVKKYGQFISKRLVDMKKAGLVSVRNDGVKKIWSVV